MEKSSKIYIAGHRGMLGSSFLRSLQAKGYTNFVLKTSSELDLRNQYAVADFFVLEKPDYVIHGAAESFVDDSIASAKPFIHSNVVGTQVMVDLALKHNVKITLNIF